MGWRRRMRSRLYASVSRMGTGTNPNPAPDTLLSLRMFRRRRKCFAPVLLQWKMCQFDGCLGIARVLVKRTSLDAHIQVGGLTRTRFAQSNATEPAQEDVRVCVCVMVVVDSWYGNMYLHLHVGRHPQFTWGSLMSTITIRLLRSSPFTYKNYVWLSFTMRVPRSLRKYTHDTRTLTTSVQARLRHVFFDDVQNLQ